jgi:hypothetical protein
MNVLNGCRNMVLSEGYTWLLEQVKSKMRIAEGNELRVIEGGYSN